MASANRSLKILESMVETNTARAKENVELLAALKRDLTDQIENQNRTMIEMMTQLMGAVNENGKRLNDLNNRLTQLENQQK